MSSSFAEWELKVLEGKKRIPPSNKIQMRDVALSSHEETLHHSAL
jgi:hypothetical protein